MSVIDEVRSDWLSNRELPDVLALFGVATSRASPWRQQTVVNETESRDARGFWARFRFLYAGVANCSAHENQMSGLGGRLIAQGQIIANSGKSLPSGF